VDELRFALIIAGILLIAVIYFVTSRGRRRDKLAGRFDPAGAWADEEADPLLDDVRPRSEPPEGDDLEITAINPAVKPHSDVQPEVPVSDVELETQSVTGTEAQSLQKPQREPPQVPVLPDIDVVADSVDESREPQLGSLDDLDLPVLASHSEPSVEKTKASSVKKPTSKATRKIATPKLIPEYSMPEDMSNIEPLAIVINIMARDGSHFPGVDVEAALEEAGLKFGEMQLYHYRTETQPAGTLPIFTALNMVKPGTLAPEQFPEMKTPGIAMVLRLPGVEEPARAFEFMYKACQIAEDYLGGTLCDETRSHLTPQVLNHLREQVSEYSRKLRLKTS
jgi:cell division protein ZipA